MDDFDIEMGDAMDIPMEDEHQVDEILIGDDLQVCQQTIRTTNAKHNGTDYPISQEDGEIEEPANGATDESQRIVPNKVHIRGLDQLDQDKLKEYVSSHVGGKGADRIEWVNDSSANLVFASESIAQEALLHLSAVDVADVTQIPLGEVLPAKPIADKPEIALHVRFAVESDKKERGAALKSRFYLFNPDWDPETEEGRRRREGRDKRYRERDDRGAYRRGGRGRYDDRYDDRGEEAPETFDVNLYDDDPKALSKRATLSDRPGSSRGRRSGPGRRRYSRSRSPSDNDSYVSANRDKELFPDNRPKHTLRSDRGSSSRNRSFSPRNDRDAMEDDLAKDREAMRNNRDKARSIKERIYSTSKRTDSAPRELFPSAGGAKELFPSKTEGAGNKAQMDRINEGMACLSYDGSFDSDGSTPVSPSSPSSHGRAASLRFYQKMSLPDGQFLMRYKVDQPVSSVRGRGPSRAEPNPSAGFLTIKGTAKSVKELFPTKFNNDSPTNSSNAGRELFADKLDGRNRNRRRAGDLFD